MLEAQNARIFLPRIGMLWCLRVKLKQTSFERLLRTTGDRDIVEDSHREMSCWGDCSWNFGKRS